MSLHKSLVYRISRTRKRNVLTRKERIEILSLEGRLASKDSVFGLPKVKPTERRVLSQRAARLHASESEE